jgi:anaerobic magnesium-protoporphyrin IX monomethyl ester cyclase
MINKKEIVLVYPDFRSRVYSAPGLPVGLGYIARALETAGIGYEVVDLNIDSIGYLMSRISELSPRFLGMSMLSYRCKGTYQLLQNLKHQFPRLQIIAGGPHITANRETVLNECPAIDVGVVGEGENAIIDIVHGDAPATIKGMLFREECAVRFTGERDFVPDLDQVPFPTYAGFRLEKYGKTMPLHSSRGCPYRCIFCGAPRILGRKWRKRSAHSMAQEVRYWYDKGYRSYYFSDSNFAVDKMRVWDFCQEMIDSSLAVGFASDGLRADHVDRDLLVQMSRAGFRAVTFGVESGSDKVLRNLMKGETRASIESAIKAAVDLGLRVSLFFLIGSPGEEADDIEQSFELARKYNVARVYFFTLTPIPGTEFYDWVLARGHLEGRETRYPEGNFGLEEKADFPTDTMTIDQLNRNIKLARRIERQVMHRFLLQRFLGRSEMASALVGKNALDSLSWFFSHPVMTPVSRFVGPLATLAALHMRRLCHRCQTS